MQIVFHGENAASFSEGFSSLVEKTDRICLLPDKLTTAQEQQAYQNADFIIGVKFDSSLPMPKQLKLFHVPGAGFDAVDLGLLPLTATVCNCFGHEQAIAEYIFAALLARHVPLTDADAQLRKGEWKYWAGALGRTHDEMSAKTIGLLGFGHIGKAIAARAKAFGMRVHVANRSKIPPSKDVDQSFTLDQLQPFWGSVDYIVSSLPLTDETRNIVNSQAFAAMRKQAVLFNVGRGQTVDETALYEALKTNQIAGAVIDTWYVYPSPDAPNPQPSSHPFHELTNIVMTPHMSGWTHGTIQRRQKIIAENIMNRRQNKTCVNVIRARN